jgi:hypothetical protein
MSRRRPSCVIVFVSFGHASDPKDLRTWRELQPHEISGYDADDYAPGFRDLKFPSSRDAWEWLDDNASGPDIRNIGARFCIVQKH